MYFWTVCSKCSNGVDHKLFLRWKINCIVTTFLPTYLFTQMHFWDPILNFRNLSLMELKSSCNVLSNGMLELLKSWASTFIFSIERNFYSWLKRLGKLFSLFSRNFYTVAGVTNYVKAIHIVCGWFLSWWYFWCLNSSCSNLILFRELSSCPWTHEHCYD